MHKWKSTQLVVVSLPNWIATKPKNNEFWIDHISKFICLARISHPPKRFSQHFCQVVTYKKKTELHHDSIHPESSLKQTLQQDLSIIFIDFRKTKPYIYIYPYPFEVTWILHGLINDVIYIAPGANRCPKALFDLGCMDAIGISDQAHGLRIAWPRMGIRWFFLSQLGHGRPAWIS